MQVDQSETYWYDMDEAEYDAEELDVHGAYCGFLFLASLLFLNEQDLRNVVLLKSPRE
jgi:hypothetical protein